MGCPQSVYLAHKDEIDKNVKGYTMNELQSIYETYLEVAWRFARKGDIKNAKKTLKTLKKVLKNEKKAKG